MIARLTGKVVSTDAGSLVLDVNGVGYLAHVPLSLLAALPESSANVTLYTSMVVRDDDIALYGFRSEAELELFRRLTSVTGVGPRVALSMLSAFEGHELARAISSNDAKALTLIPGVGPKLAQRVVLELGDAMAQFAFDQAVQRVDSGPSAVRSALFEDIVEALVGLQYNRADARRAAEKAIAASGGSADGPALIRLALNSLSGEGGR
ncbi:MAG: Holliday junction branch migration protein RuvA [Chthonomonadales bacterium]|nr:Holliday junction branch migration protein RuvA [Chthonomonadales bacterium]